MTMNPLPPQAYTKETLLKAYQWLMGQNSSLKEIATTPDILVSLYLKATRDGDHALERPSIQNFKNELRNLAGMMGELDRPAGAQAHAHVQTHVAQPSPHTQPSIYQQAPQTPVATAPTPAQSVQMVAAASVETQMPTVAPSQVVRASAHIPATPATTQSSDVIEVLDGSTRAMIQEVKAEFNLSCELEALRMLVKIGYSRSKGLLS